MSSSPPVLIITILLTGILGAAAARSKKFAGIGSLSLSGKALAIMPGLLTLCLFYSLALHMHSSLGSWPTTIGTDGFTPQLQTHAAIAAWLFGILLILSLLIWPVAALISSLNTRLRPALPYLGIFAVSASACFLLTALAPSEFLYWWWD